MRHPEERIGKADRLRQFNDHCSVCGAYLPGNEETHYFSNDGYEVDWNKGTSYCGMCDPNSETYKPKQRNELRKENTEDTPLSVDRGNR